LVKDLGLDLATAGLIFSASQAAGIGGQIGWAAISDRLLGAHAVMAMIGVIMTASAVLSATFSPAWPTAALVAVAVLYGVSAAGFIPVMLGEVTRAAPPGQAGVLTSGSGAFLTAGLLLGPLIFGGVASTLGYPGAFLTLAACTLTGAIIVADNLRAYRAKTAVGREAMPAREPLTNPE
jgi:MFS family permease